MSKNINIQQNGVPDPMEVDALMLQKPDGGQGKWCPDEGFELANITIREPGEYKASDYGYYGFSKVTVRLNESGGTDISHVSASTEESTVAIMEGGKTYQFSAKKLKTPLVGGDICLWVPKHSVMLISRSITKDGTYRASDYGYYGFSSVLVTSASDMVPSSIVVTSRPDKIAYNDGDVIDYTGMVVKAYTESGNLWTDDAHPTGVIPINELTLPWTNAIYGRSYGEVTPPPGLDTSNIEYFNTVTIGGFAVKFKNSPTENKGRYYYFETALSDVEYTVLLNDKALVGFSREEHAEGFPYMYANWHATESEPLHTLRFAGTYKSKTLINQIPFYYASYTGSAGQSVKPYEQSGAYPEDAYLHYGTEERNADVIGTILYDGAVTPIAGPNVPVQWNRPGDGKQLQTYFSIVIAPPNSND